MRATNFKVAEGGALSLSDDLTINDLTLESDGTLRLNGHTLTIISLQHRRGKGWVDEKGVKTGLSGTVVLDGGHVRWMPRGLMLFVR